MGFRKRSQGNPQTKNSEGKRNRKPQDSPSVAPVVDKSTPAPRAEKLPYVNKKQNL